MEDLNMNCLTLNNAILYTADEFGKKYYGDDFNMVRIDWEDDCLHYNLQINDEYRNIDEIYTALWYDIPRDTLFQYKEERLSIALSREKKKKVMPNLKNFYLMKQSEWKKESHEVQTN